MIEETQLAFFALLAQATTEFAQDPKQALQKYSPVFNIMEAFGIGSDPDKIPDTATEEKFGAWLAQVSAQLNAGTVTPEQAAMIIQQGNALEAATLQAFLRDESRNTWNRVPGGPGFLWDRMKNLNPTANFEQNRQGLISIANSQSLGFVSDIPVVGDLLGGVTGSGLVEPVAGGGIGWWLAGLKGALLGTAAGWYLGRKK